MTSTIDTPGTAQRPTRVRVVVVGLAILLGMVTYLDRACIANLAKPIMHDLELTEKYELSYAQTAFAMAYGAFGILSAWWADRVGTRIMLTAVVLAWSIFTMATGAAQGMISLIIIQFCFGAAEAGAWPAITRTLSRWIPYRERGTAQGIVWIGAHITVALTPMLVLRTEPLPVVAIDLLRSSAWSACSGRPSGIGGFAMSRRSTGKSTPRNWPISWPTASLPRPRSTRPAGRGMRRPAFWRRLLTHRNVLALCLMYLPNSFIFYFCITWFPTYLSEGRGMEGRTLAFFAGLPLMLSVAADLLGGPTTDWAVRRFGPRWGRAGVGLASYVVAGATVLLAAIAEDAWLAATLFALGTAANMFLLGSAWATCQDIGGGTCRRGQRDDEHGRPGWRHDLPAVGELCGTIITAGTRT